MHLVSTITWLSFGLLAATQSPPTLTVEVNVEGAVIPGSVYLTPYGIPGAAPYVFSLTGSTLFSGLGKTGQGAVHNFHPCTYNKTEHFCLWKGTVTNGYGKGDALVLNQQFSVVKTLPNVDFHEFKLKQSLNPTNGKVIDTALLTSYTSVQRDLSAFGIPSETSQGWVIDCHVRAVDLSTGRTVFDWSSLDHVPLNESLVLPTGAIGGQTQQFAWDYFHMSSVDRLGSGDYLVSSRHTSTIYRVSGKDGSIIWRLGGKASTFTLQGFKFSSQHDVRIIRDKGDILTLSLFDNAYNSFTPPQGDPSGKIIELNVAAKTARLLRQYNHPQAGLQASDGGSLMILPKGNVCIGWGSVPYVTEHTPDGQPVYSARFGGIGSSAFSYRAFKAPFRGITPTRRV
ncbi:MAG: hypothetical protein LQ341_000103 [Variospora aurantia]|nr:MAG: hypothetical protein LQ341_000103 [Variospora aurantia]